MRFASETGQLKQFRLELPEFQQTFKTPLQNLYRFVRTFLSPFGINEGYVALEQIVFEPQTLIEMLKDHSILVEDCHGALIAAENSDEVSHLLEATFTDWIDFIFIPTPRLFSIYADHDEWATFFVDDSAVLDRITTALTDAGFEAITEWRRKF